MHFPSRSLLSDCTFFPFFLLSCSDACTIFFPLGKFFAFSVFFSSHCCGVYLLVDWDVIFLHSFYSALAMCDPFSFLLTNNFPPPLVSFSPHCCGMHLLFDREVLLSFHPPFILLLDISFFSFCCYFALAEAS